MISRTLVAFYISLYISIKQVWGIIFEYFCSCMCIDLTVSHFHFVPIHVVLMSYIPQTGSVLIASNECLSILVLPIPFLLSLFYDLLVALLLRLCRPAIVVRSPLLGIRLSALLSWWLNWETCFGSKICVREL